MTSSRAAAAYSPPIHSHTSFHSGLGSCRHCFSTIGRDAAAVHLQHTHTHTQNDGAAAQVSLVRHSMDVLNTYVQAVVMPAH